MILPKPIRGRLVRPLMILLLTGCAGSHASRASAPSDRNLISEAEIRASPATNAYDLVRQLRPRWLQTRGVTSFQTQINVALYVEGVHVGDITRLRDYDTGDLRELKFLSGPEATQVYGTDHPAGAIQLFLRRGH